MSFSNCASLLFVSMKDVVFFVGVGVLMMGEDMVGFVATLSSYCEEEGKRTLSLCVCRGQRAGDGDGDAESDKYSNASSELHSGKRLVLDEWGIQNKRTNDLQSSSRRSSLEQIADHIFAESQHAAGNETPVISRQSTSSNASWQGNHYVGSRELGEPYIKESIYMQPVSGGLSKGHNQGSLPNGNNQGSLPNVHNQGYQAYESGVSTASPRKERFLPKDSAGSHLLYPTSGSQMYHQRSMEMPPDRGLPKFGDWDAMDPTKVEFTVIFDKARNERKVSVNQEYTSVNKTAPEVDEDLYKPSSVQRRKGFWTWICCSSPAV
ncbi:hypothetical protein GOP47_0008741 [Adiantum capillus-veneris]|uniref:RIN4 pathogenic type III effector avirulence factor Avr cleavage site domain-containing protein n=1 Tax=Adiantum capillus-veneris TaxID=13818 RepID=A0A9D4ZKP4_ADICA|nr:hypothetical protein GOP47_0008741 [Adiantum capillus-veneris]